MNEAAICRLASGITAAISCSDDETADVGRELAEMLLVKIEGEESFSFQMVRESIHRAIEDRYGAHA